MAVFVNYYPCSYGDSLVAMFLSKPLYRESDLAVADTHYFKLQSFYAMPDPARRSILNNLPKQGIYSCHRQHGIDFGLDHVVISIDVDHVEWLCARVRHIHLDKMALSLDNPIARRVLERQGLDQAIRHDYVTWKRKNILSTDICIRDTDFCDTKGIEVLCQTHHLGFNEHWLKDIQQDIRAQLETKT